MPNPKKITILAVEGDITFNLKAINIGWTEQPSAHFLKIWPN